MRIQASAGQMVPRRKHQAALSAGLEVADSCQHILLRLRAGHNISEEESSWVGQQYVSGRAVVTKHYVQTTQTHSIIACGFPPKRCEL